MGHEVFLSRSLSTTLSRPWADATVVPEPGAVSKRPARTTVSFMSKVSNNVGTNPPSSVKVDVIVRFW
ncbi:hypothetical protein LINPERPRIM_LOCUS13658 [Linum perenne]